MLRLTFIFGFLPRSTRDKIKNPKMLCGQGMKSGEALFVFFRLPLSFVPFRDLTSFLLFFGAHVLSSFQIPWACFGFGRHGHSKL